MKVYPRRASISGPNNHKKSLEGLPLFSHETIGRRSSVLTHPHTHPSHQQAAPFYMYAQAREVLFAGCGTHAREREREEREIKHKHNSKIKCPRTGGKGGEVCFSHIFVSAQCVFSQEKNERRFRKCHLGPARLGTGRYQ